MSFPVWLPSPGVLSRQLKAVPLDRSVPCVDKSLLGWTQRLVSPANGDADPGVYATSFAIRLLCDAEGVDATKLGPLLTGGLRFLLDQYSAAQDVGDPSKVRDGHKQRKKVRDLGHHDFVLELKNCAVVEAASALVAARERQTSGELGPLLATHSVRLSELAEAIKSRAVSTGAAEATMTSWGWHVFNAVGTPDPLASAHVVLALTHEMLKPTNGYLDDWRPAVKYLNHALRSSVSISTKAQLVIALAKVGTRVGEAGLVDGPAREIVLPELRAAVRNLGDFGWQEPLHYPVPSADGQARSYYWPFIWIFPRMDVVQAMLILSPTEGLPFAARMSAQLANNMRRHGGLIRFVGAQPPLMLAQKRASDFFDAVQPNLTGAGRWVYVREYFRERIKATAGRVQPAFNLLLIFLVVDRLLGSFALPASVAEVLTRSGNWLQATGHVVLGVWPIWVVYLGAQVMVGTGSVRERLRRAFVVFIEVVVLAILINLLTNPAQS